MWSGMDVVLTPHIAACTAPAGGVTTLHSVEAHCSMTFTTTVTTTVTTATVAARGA